MTNEIMDLSARELASAIREKRISAREALTAHLAQIEIVNPAINAIVTLDVESAKAAAAAADVRTISSPDGLPALHGVPMTHKDTINTKGLRTTYGSSIFKDHIPGTDDLIIQRLKSAGIVSTGKSNVPEFAAGSHTFNDLFGTTTNPYDPTLSAGGSSGGVAAAIAARIQAIGDGTDMGGSLRIPASFCNVVGLRPSTGAIPSLPSRNTHSWLGQMGPMAREVSDIALVMSTVVGSHPGHPVPSPVSSRRFTEPLAADMTGLRIAWSPDFGIGVPVQKEVLRVLEQQLAVFESLGAHVEEASPDLTDADTVFGNVRAHDFVLQFGDLVQKHGDLIKPEVRWNVEQGLRLTGQHWVDTSLARTRLAKQMDDFFAKYDVLATPCAQVLPFDASLRYPISIDGVELETYLDWMRSACVISATGLPALSMPAGFSTHGLPVGIQLVMNQGQDFELLQVGYAFEQVTGFARQAPEMLTSVKT